MSGRCCHCPIPALTVERQPDGCVRLRCRICRRLEGPTLTTLLAEQHHIERLHRQGHTYACAEATVYAGAGCGCRRAREVRDA